MDVMKSRKRPRSGSSLSRRTPQPLVALTLLLVWTFQTQIVGAKLRYSYTLGSVSVTQLRGGAEMNPTDKEETRIDGPSSDEPTGETRSSPWTPLWQITSDAGKLLPSLFQINNDVKSSVVDDVIVKSPHNNGRGGALVKTAKPKRFQWLAPLDVTRVAPSSSRLLTDESSKAGASKSATVDAAIAKNPFELLLLSKPKEVVDRTEEAFGADGSVEAEQEGTPKADKNDQQLVADKTDGFKAELEEKADAKVADGSAPHVANDVLRETSPETMLTNNTQTESESPYVSSGYWSTIDKALTFGYAGGHPAWRVSRRLRTVRKAAARVTGLRGVLSGKTIVLGNATEDYRMGIVQRRLAAIARARQNVEKITTEELARRDGQGFAFWRQRKSTVDANSFDFVMKRSAEEILRDRRKSERVKEIDRLIAESQLQMQELVCEKDMLQKRPNPLWKYTVEDEGEDKVDIAGPSSGEDESGSTTSLGVATRRFKFPPPDLVDEYLDVLISSRRLVKLNHTDLWKNNGALDEEDDDDELLSPSDFDSNGRRRRIANGGSGSWLLRNGLGEKIGEAAETAGYKAVCGAVMSVLARSLSGLHGLNVMHYSYIRLFMENVPDLPPLAAGIIPGSNVHANYAQGALENAMRKGVKKRRKRQSRRQGGYSSEDGDFIQRDAVVETLLSQSQISAPLLKLFPLAWQRALLGNLITLITAVIGDFFEGMEFQILGHRLSFVFLPITEADMIRNLGSLGEGFNRHRPRPEDFEAAVQATAESLAEELNFLDRWHERALGSGMLRAQIANLIARLVLSLIDDILRGARMDLWTAHAGGPRLVAGLEYRTTSSEESSDPVP